MSVFADPRIIKLINREFVAVADNDWYSRRRQDDVGKFFRSVANQGPRKGEGGNTRQGHYALTASGKLLVYNNNRSVRHRLDMINAALRKWKALPASERKPGAVKVPAHGTTDRKYQRTPPKDGIILRTFTRVLDRTADGYKACSPDRGEKKPRGYDAAFDHVWITTKESRELAEGGIPEAVALRLIRFHLHDNTRGEPPFWSRKDLRSWKLTPTKTEPHRIELTGEVHLATASNDRGYEAKLRGVIETDPKSKKITRLNLVAVGDHWGEGRYTGGARPGKNPLGVAFELADGSHPGDRVPPQASSWEQGYYEANRH